MKTIKIAPHVPTTVNVEDIGDNHIRIVAFPYETGCAVTFAHPIRRLLLSSSVGYAPIAIRIDGVSHEFDSIRGISEDVSQLIVNIKNIRFVPKVNTEAELNLEYSFSGAMELTAGMLVNDFVDVANKDMHLATINSNDDFVFSFSILLRSGIGYVASENIRSFVPDTFIPLDAYFTPVKKASYEIENVLVDDDPNYEKIIFDIQTDGQVDPLSAFKRAISVMHEQISVFGLDLGLNNVSCAPSVNTSEDSAELKVLTTKIDDLNLSTRCFKCLDGAGVNYVGDLVRMNESEIKNIRNLGKKSYDELIDKLEELGYSVGNELPSNLILAFDNKVNKN